MFKKHPDTEKKRNHFTFPVSWLPKNHRPKVLVMHHRQSMAGQGDLLDGFGSLKLKPPELGILEGSFFFGCFLPCFPYLFGGLSETFAEVEPCWAQKIRACVAKKELAKNFGNLCNWSPSHCHEFRHGWIGLNGGARRILRTTCEHWKLPFLSDPLKTSTRMAGAPTPGPAVGLEKSLDFNGLNNLATSSNTKAYRMIQYQLSSHAIPLNTPSAWGLRRKRRVQTGNSMQRLTHAFCFVDLRQKRRKKC